MADDEKKPPQSLTVTPSSAEVFTGETVQLTASNPQASWSSANTAVAVVGASGLVTGTGPGETAIKAQYKGEKGEMRITVRNKDDIDNITPPPTNPSGYGPQASQTQPGGSVSVSPGAGTIQAAVAGNAAGTSFWLTAGTYALTGPITPKTGNTFTGQYGAIIDGAGISSSDPNTGAFQAHNLDIDNVTIKNLLIQNCPQKAIHGFKDSADNWTVEYCELAHNKVGINAPDNSFVRHCYIHHNVGSDEGSGDLALHGGGYSAYQSTNTVFEDNEFSFNGSESKILEANTITFRRNYVHDNAPNGIWFDGENPNSVIEDNTVDDHASEGIFYEVSGSGVIRGNTIRRSGGSGIFISTSKGVEIYDNVLEDNYRGIQYYIDCARIGQGIIGFDLADNNSHNNTIRLGATAGIAASVLGSGNCDAAALLPYTSGAKNLVFQANTYAASNTTGAWWYWNGAFKTWAQWQSLGHDLSGSISVR